MILIALIVLLTLPLSLILKPVLAGHAA